MSKAPAPAPKSAPKAAPAGVLVVEGPDDMGMGSNVEPKIAEVEDNVKLIAKLIARNDELTAMLAKVGQISDVIDKPHTDNDEVAELFKQDPTAQPVKRMQVKRVWIILEQNSNIPRNGLQLGINGYQYLLKPGLRAHVPVGIVDILRHAIEGKPVVDPDTLQVKSYEPTLRFPFRIVRGEAPDAARRPSASDYEADAA